MVVATNDEQHCCYDLIKILLTVLKIPFICLGRNPPATKVHLTQGKYHYQIYISAQPTRKLCEHVHGKFPKES